MNRTLTATEPLRRVTQQELDSRISQVASELFSDGIAENDASADWIPVPIRAAELVRRMQPFVVYN